MFANVRSNTHARARGEGYLSFVSFDAIGQQHPFCGLNWRVNTSLFVLVASRSGSMNSFVSAFRTGSNNPFDASFRGATPK